MAEIALSGEKNRPGENNNGFDKTIFLAGAEAAVQSKQEVSPANEQENILAEETSPSQEKQAVDLGIKAEAALSVKIQPNLPPQILFSQNSEKKLPIASLTKLMTALLVLKNYDLNQKISVSAEAMKRAGEQGDLKQGQVFSAQEMLYMVLMESSNRASYALAEAIGVEKFVYLMNEKARDLGMFSTSFADVSGLSSESRSTAEDLLKLIYRLVESHPLFNKITGLREFNLYNPDGTFHHKITNTNKLLGEENIIGGKTGWTDEAKGCLAVVRRKSEDGEYFIDIVLGAEDRFLEVKKLISMS